MRSRWPVAKPVRRTPLPLALRVSLRPLARARLSAALRARGQVGGGLDHRQPWRGEVERVRPTSGPGTTHHIQPLERIASRRARA